MYDKRSEDKLINIFVMKSFIAFILLLLSIPVVSQDFRSVKWLDSKSVVKANEVGIFQGENDKGNHIEELQYIEFEDGFAYQINYVFKKDQLIGIKTQRSRLSGDNTKFNAISDYSDIFAKYIALYGEDKIKEKETDEQAIKIMEIRLQDKDVYVTVSKTGSEYFLVENIFKRL